VRNQRGKPIANAYAATLEERGETYGPSNPQGIIHLPTDQRHQPLSVGAAGYETAILEQPKDGVQGSVVTLVRTTDLTIRWQVPPQIDLSDMTVQILSAQGDVILKGVLFEEVEARLRQAIGLDWWANSESIPMGKAIAWWGLDAQQKEIRIWGLEPGLWLEIQIQDYLDNAVTRSERVMLKQGEPRELELQLLSLPRTLACQVVDSSGQPLGDGEYHFGMTAEDGYSTGFDESGFFMCEASMSTHVWLEVAVPGYGLYVNESLEIPRDGSPVKIIMERGRDLQINFQDINGELYSDGYCWSGAMAGIYTEDQPGDASLLKDAPQGRFRLEWFLGGLSGSQWIEPAVTKVIVRVPAMGSMDIRLSRLDAAEEEYCDIALKPAENNSFSAEKYYYESSEKFMPRTRARSHEVSTLPAGFYFIELERRHAEDIPRRFGPFEVLAGEKLTVTLEY
jgi:hypothetical protein